MSVFFLQRKNILVKQRNCLFCSSNRISNKFKFVSKKKNNSGLCEYFFVVPQFGDNFILYSLSLNNLNCLL